MAKFFYYPFAVHGDVNPVPDVAQDNGSVSYYAGYGSNYQLPLAGGGSALPIDRGQYNQILNDITGALANIQSQGVFSWIGPVADPPLSGANYPYPINALVYYTDGNIYQSLINNNQDVPGSSLNWVNISSNTGVPIGSIIDYGGVAIPSDCLLCDGTAYSRTTYSNLFIAITNTQTGNTHTTTTVDGLSSTSNLKVGFYVSGSGVQAGTTIASITDSTSLVLSLPTTSTVTGNSLVFAPWGIGDGTSTFNVPDLRRSVTIGSGGTASSIIPPGISNTLGSKGGEELHTLSIAEMPSHNHPGSTSVPPSGQRGGASGTGIIATSDNSGSLSLSIASQGGDTGHNTIQPSTVVYKIIKFR